jgi:hypothetical protein
MLPAFASQCVATAIMSIVLVAGADNARACDCPWSGISVSELLKPNSKKLSALPPDSGVFIGRVITYVPPWRQDQPSSTTFEVLKVLKGDIPNPLTLRGTASSENSCGFSWQVSDKVIVLVIHKAYPSEMAGDGGWTAGLCRQAGQDVTPSILLDFVTRGAQ